MPSISAYASRTVACSLTTVACLKSRGPGTVGLHDQIFHGAYCFNVVIGPSVSASSRR